jgi:hypothetical protein
MTSFDREIITFVSDKSSSHDWFSSVFCKFLKIILTSLAMNLHVLKNFLMRDSWRCFSFFVATFTRSKYSWYVKAALRAAFLFDSSSELTISKSFTWRDVDCDIFLSEIFSEYKSRFRLLYNEIFDSSNEAFLRMRSRFFWIVERVLL